MSNHKIVETTNDIWNVQETYKDKPHGWIQWKGTGVCMDVHCKCGEMTHVDADFCYHIKCCHCGTVYAVNGHVEFIELIEEPDTCVVMSEGEEEY